MKFRFFLTHGFIKKKIKELKKNKKNDSFCVFLMDFKNVLNEEIKNSILESSGISKQILVEYIQSSSLAIGYAKKETGEIINLQVFRGLFVSKSIVALLNRNDGFIIVVD